VAVAVHQIYQLIIQVVEPRTSAQRVSAVDMVETMVSLVVPSVKAVVVVEATGVPVRTTTMDLQVEVVPDHHHISPMESPKYSMAVVEVVVETVDRTYLTFEGRYCVGGQYAVGYDLALF